MIDWANVVSNFSGTFPNVSGINATGPGTTDGTEFTAAFINNFIFGFSQALMDYANLTPDGVSEGAGASQLIEAIQKGNGIGPGKIVGWFLADDPSVTGDRVLLLNGQGILVATYSDLATAVYVGDANNAAVAAGGGAFYKADDAAGTTPNISGAYLILPESRGYALRGLDVAGSVDPDGASRFLGDNQSDEYKSHNHTLSYFSGSPSSCGNTSNFVRNATNDSGSYICTLSGTITSMGLSGGDETRMANLSIKFGITY